MPSKRKPKDDEQSVTSEGKQPAKNLASLMGEAEKFFRDQLYLKAIQCYTEALELSPGNKNALVERSACYLKIGKNTEALADAEESLKDINTTPFVKEFTKGLYQKAEALYAMGEFELALVFYHRGKKLRGDVKEFQLGINKAQEAIDNCVGDPNAVKLEVKGDLSYFDKPDEKQKKQQRVGYQKPLAQKQQVVQKREKRQSKPDSQKTVKQLLGELYADKMYLESLLQDDHATRANTKSGDAIWGLANNGLDFLDSRTEFWRQQKPIYARKSTKQSTDSSLSNKNPLKYILNQLEIIDNLQTNGKYSESLDKSNKLMIYVNKLPDTQLTERKAIVSNIYSNIGNAHLEMGKYEQALQAHQKDLDISKETDNKEGISRAYENIGRVYARNGKYREAIDVWEKKLPMADTDMEKAWLYHEIGRCHLEINDYKAAQEYGEKSLEFAEKINDETWKLNATVLIAQAQAKIETVESLKNSIENFEKAIIITEKQNNESASKMIRKALNDCKDKLKKLQVNTPRDEENKKDSSSTKESPDRDSPEKRSEKNRDSPEKRSEKNSQSPTTKTSNTPTKTETESPRTNANNSSRKESSTNDSKSQSKMSTSRPVDYWIHTKTSNEMSSGTDANVFINLIGTDGEINDLELKNSDNSTPFESGRLDHFEFKNLKDIGKLKKIKIGHDGQNKGSSWELEYVRVIYNNNLYLFEINKWLDIEFKNPSDKLVSVEVEPSKLIDGVCVYEVDVKTDDDASAGTDANIKISFYGTKGEVLDLPLINPSNNKNPFERDALDKFELMEKNVGKITKITISVDGEGTGSSWKLEYINIIAESMFYSFTVNKWLEAGKIDLNPDSEPISEAERAEYNINVTTANKIGAGTNSNVFINIYGDKGETGKIQLKKAANNKNPFEKGKTDNFKFKFKNVGEIKKINISHDGIGVGDGWFCDKIEVQNMKNNSVINFPVERWLDIAEGDCRTSLDLEPNKKPDNKN